MEEYIDVYLTQNPESINYQNKEGWTALTLASANSSALSTDKTVEIILKHRPDINLKDIDGWTPLMYAAINSQSTSSERTVELLLEHGANVNLQEDDGWTALMFSSRYSKNHSSEKTVELLLKYNADINIKNREDNDVLNVCILNPQFCTEGTIKIFLERTFNCDIEINNRKLIKRLWKAKFSDEIIELAIQRGAKLSDLIDERIIKFIDARNK